MAWVFFFFLTSFVGSFVRERKKNVTHLSVCLLAVKKIKRSYCTRFDLKTLLRRETFVKKDNEISLLPLAVNNRSISSLIRFSRVSFFDSQRQRQRVLKC